MKKQTWLIIFVLVLLGNVAAVYLDNASMRMITKPLLMPTLGIYFLTATITFTHGLKPWIVAALFFAWVGDVLLLFEDRGQIFFLLGLSAFLLAHIFYIVFFHNIRRREYIYGNALFLLLVIIYYAMIMDILSPHLGEMKLPVRIYGVVISFMLMLAMHTLLGKNKRAGWWMTIGAVLFVVSDSLLAFNKFYEPFENAGVMIILSYGLAQLFIVMGSVLYLATPKEKLRDEAN